MKTILIKNAKIFIDTEHDRLFTGDLLIKNGLIKEISRKIEMEADEVIDATGKYVSPGFIDIHTHCYPIGKLGMNPDELGVERWSSTIVDAGTSGANTFEDFKANHIDNAKTKVFALLNLSGDGLKEGHELDSLEKLESDKVRELVKKYPETIVGLKARASKSVVGKLGILPIKLTVELAYELNVPIMVHVGNYPPALTEVLDCLHKGDMITHAFHGKPGGLIQNGEILPEAIKARERGVLFDVGHGEESFSFNTYKKAKKLGFDCDSISSDLHTGNYQGPVFSQLLCVNKLLNCGNSLSKVIDLTTRRPAENLHLKGLGKLEVGTIGDVFIFDYIDANEIVKDSMGNTLRITKKIEPVKLIISKGEQSEILSAND